MLTKFNAFLKKYKGAKTSLIIIISYLLIHLLLFSCTTILAGKNNDFMPNDINISDSPVTDMVLSNDEQYAYICGRYYGTHGLYYTSGGIYIIKIDRSGNIVNARYDDSSSAVWGLKLLENGYIEVTENEMQKKCITTI